MFSKQTESSIPHAIAGAISGFVTRFVFQPLDVIKIRFQLQVEPISRHEISKYQSVLQAFKLILKEEGIPALWKGHIPAQLLSISFGMSQFYFFNVITRLSNENILHEWRYVTTFMTGASAAMIATFVSFPFDTIRTRLIAQSTNHQIYNGVFHCCSSVVRQESPKVLFYGLSPTLLQVFPHAGIQFASYRFFTDISKKYLPSNNMSWYNSMLTGGMAGLTAKTVVYPFDLARKRLQIQGFEHGRKGFGKFFKCQGLLSCLRLTAREEGLSGLFKGLIPSQTKAALTTGAYFTVYEQALLWLTPKH